MAQIAIPVKNRAGKKAVSIFQRNHLTAMKMSSQDQVVATLSRSFPYAWVVCAKDSDIAVGQSRRVRTGDGNVTKTMRYQRCAVMNPVASTDDHCFTDSTQTDTVVMISANSKDRPEFA